jgi:hypothetical protein
MLEHPGRSGAGFGACPEAGSLRLSRRSPSGWVRKRVWCGACTDNPCSVNAAHGQAVGKAELTAVKCRITLHQAAGVVWLRKRLISCAEQGSFRFVAAEEGWPGVGKVYRCAVRWGRQPPLSIQTSLEILGTCEILPPPAPARRRSCCRKGCHGDPIYGGGKPRGRPHPCIITCVPVGEEPDLVPLRSLRRR